MTTIVATLWAKFKSAQSSVRASLSPRLVINTSLAQIFIVCEILGMVQGFMRPNNEIIRIMQKYATQ